MAKWLLNRTRCYEGAQDIRLPGVVPAMVGWFLRPGPLWAPYGLMRISA